MMQFQRRWSATYLDLLVFRCEPWTVPSRNKLQQFAWCPEHETADSSLKEIQIVLILNRNIRVLQVAL